MKRVAKLVQAAQVPAEAWAEVPIAAVQAGQVQAAQVPVGQVPVGQVPVGQVPVGQEPAGQVPVAQVPVGQAWAAQVQAGVPAGSGFGRQLKPEQQDQALVWPGVVQAAGWGVYLPV